VNVPHYPRFHLHAINAVWNMLVRSQRAAQIDRNGVTLIAAGDPNTVYEIMFRE
jgi:hypothetical protein